ncbi:MAG: TetR/AcrR family transcriptional regulator [Neomegalonema sp.]|nr:TetR/AcrR family transcriptional regulator [Neomegalonema sp.]
MARPRKFDENLARSAAMATFWRHGYSGASYDKLVEATGASRKGLYSIWPDKASLYLDCLNYYRTNVGAPFMEQLRSSSISADDFDAIWRELGVMEHNGELMRGCMICRAAVEGAAKSEKVRLATHAYFRDIGAAFGEALTTLWRGGDAPEGVNPVARGQEAAAVFISISALAASPFDPAIAQLRNVGRRTRL